MEPCEAWSIRRNVSEGGDMKNPLATTPGIIVVGAVIGLIAVWLQKLGNPANMGICVACFERDVAGGLGLHPGRHRPIPAP